MALTSNDPLQLPYQGPLNSQCTLPLLCSPLFLFTGPYNKTLNCKLDAELNPGSETSLSSRHSGPGDLGRQNTKRLATANPRHYLQKAKCNTIFGRQLFIVH